MMLYVQSNNIVKKRISINFLEDILTKMFSIEYQISKPKKKVTQLAGKFNFSICFKFVKTKIDSIALCIKS